MQGKHCFSCMALMCPAIPTIIVVRQQSDVRTRLGNLATWESSGTSRRHRSAAKRVFQAVLRRSRLQPRRLGTHKVQARSQAQETDRLVDRGQNRLRIYKSVRLLLMIMKISSFHIWEQRGVLKNKDMHVQPPCATTTNENEEWLVTRDLAPAAAGVDSLSLLTAWRLMSHRGRSWPRFSVSFM